MAQPKQKYGKGQLSVAVFEQIVEGGKVANEFYSVQRSRKIGEEWKNESILVSKEQLRDLQELIGQALGEGAAQ